MYEIIFNIFVNSYFFDWETATTITVLSKWHLTGFLYIIEQCAFSVAGFDLPVLCDSATNSA